MARTDLMNSSGFPIIYDGDELTAKDFEFKERNEVSIDDVREQLLNKELTCPVVFYKEFKGLDNNGLYEKKGVVTNFYTLQPNLAGIEFVKTRATVCPNYPRIIEIVYGGATVLLQEYLSPKKNRIIRISAKKKQKIIVPAGYALVVVNTRQNSNLVFAEYHCTKAKPENALDEYNGLAYYVIRKNAKQETVRNPSYKIVSEPVKVDWDSILKEYGVTPMTPIIKQIMRKYERFDWLFKENSVSI